MAAIRLTFGQYLAILGILVVVVLNTRPCVSQSLSCLRRRYTNYEAQKPGCRPKRIDVTACFGRCQTSEIPQLLPPYKMSDHDMCSYGETEVRQIQLDDCDPGVDPTFSYHNAVTCTCKRCQPEITNCQGI